MKSLSFILSGIMLGISKFSEFFFSESISSSYDLFLRLNPEGSVNTDFALFQSKVASVATELFRLSILKR